MQSSFIPAGVLRFLALQGAVVLVSSLLMLGFVDPLAAYSALLGGLVCVLPTSYFAMRLFKHRGARAANKIVASFYKGEAMKLVLTIVLFALVFKYVTIAAIPFFLTFIAAQLVAWFAPLMIK